MKQNTSQKFIQNKQILGIAGSCGILLIAIGLLLPLFNMFNPILLDICKWIYSVGAILFLISKLLVRQDKSESFRLRRLRRMEFWAGACFVVGAALWFYNQNKFSNFPAGTVGALALIRDTILFAMSGSMLEIIAVWLIYFREKKEKRESA